MIDFTTDMYFTQNTAIYSKLQSVEKNTSVVPLGSTNKISIAYFTTKIFAVWLQLPLSSDSDIRYISHPF